MKIEIQDRVLVSRIMDGVTERQIRERKITSLSSRRENSDLKTNNCRETAYGG